MRRATAALNAAILAVVLSGCATVTVKNARVITGQVTDESGKPVAANPVLLVARRLGLSAMRMEYDELGRREARTVTDTEGRYRFEFVPVAIGNNFYLFFYDTTGFDSVKYRRPEPLDITDRLQRNQTLVVNHVLQFNPSWAEVTRQIAYFGAESDRGRILRRHGLPDKREMPPAAGTGPEGWWYYADGVTYWFVGEQLTRTSQFPPMTQPPPAR
jgi:YD repeat-containing protein